MDTEDNILLVDKPESWTSFDVVAKIRGGIRSQFRDRSEKPTKKQLRVGHAGTLDPFATGLVIILKGDACKQAGEFLKLDKVYEATFMLGVTSTTGDPEGELTRVSEEIPSLEDVQKSLGGFVGEIKQTPPIYSAIKVNGQRAYKLAREGKSVEIPERTVTIYSIELISYDYPEIKVRAHVGSGTYIRTLGEDIGAALGVGAYCSQLRRTRVGKWDLTEGQGRDLLAANPS